MRILIQRVTRASVTVEGKLEGSIGPGLLLLVGVAGTDSRASADYLTDKAINLRIFSDEQGRMNLSVKDTGGELLVVSQFTLYADTRRGRRPGFEAAAPPAMARELYEYVVAALRAKGMVVQTGVFQADMKVELLNDGPVTIMLESPG